MVERVSAFKADNGNLFESEDDAKIENIKHFICKNADDQASSMIALSYVLSNALNGHRAEFIELIRRLNF